METRQDLDPAIEAEGRRLLTAAFETSLAGPVPGDAAEADQERADHEWAAVERLRRQVRRRVSRRRMRTLVPAGVVAALGAAVALALTLTATVASAPSALAAVTAAAAKTSAVSFRVTYTMTQKSSRASDYNGLPVRVTGVFDPERGLGEEETTGYETLHIRIIDGHVYVELAGSRFARARELFSHGKPWLESRLPLEHDPSFDLVRGFNGDEPIGPSALLGMLKSAASVQAAGPASGPGWTGTKYAFTDRLKYAYPGETTSGTVYVDDQGHVRRMVTNDTIGTKDAITTTFDVTFGDFGVRVSVAAPPPSQVYDLGNGHVYINSLGGLVVSRPRP